MKVPAFAAAALAAFLSWAPAKAETTLCTEIVALPFTITVQGVYCLKQNLNVNLATGNAITINAGNVIIDFNGFRINNQAPLATNEARGVYAQDRKNITIRNGFLRGFYYGVNLWEIAIDASAAHLVETMKVADSGYFGILVRGDRSIIRDNRVIETGGAEQFAYGIALQRADEGLVSRNIVSQVTAASGTFGIYISGSNLVRVVDNEVTGAGTYGIGVASTTRAFVASNRLMRNPAAGGGAVFDWNQDSFEIGCHDNVVSGFTATPLTGCDANLRNDVLFN